MSLIIDHLSFRYFVDKPILSDFSYQFHDQAITAIVGPSGIGKSTLFQLILGFLKPDEGTISHQGKLLSTPTMVLPTEKRGIGAVFQDFALFPHLTVYDNIAFGLKGSKRLHHRHILQLAKLFQLEEILSAYPYRLSGGQMQRVACARALAPHPSLILMDEPFSNLDETLTIQLRQSLKAYLKDKKMTAIIITHDAKDTLDFADFCLTIK